jgi:hypothetical protein
MHTAARVIAGLTVYIACAVAQFLLFAVVLLAAYGYKNNYVVFI